MLLTLLPWALIIGVWIWMSRRATDDARAGGPLGGMLKNRSRKFDKATSVNVTFDDVAGLKAAKRDLQEIVQFLKEPERFRRLGGKVPRGVLLVGPPGTGKTLLARAVAGEAGVPFFSISGSEFIEMFVGVGASRVRELFEEAKKSAPAIVFIDEIDAVGRSRGAGLGGGHDEREQTLNQLLSEMDGFERNDLVVVHRGDQPARRARPGAAAPGPLRSARPRRSARAGGAPGHPRRAHQGQAARRRRRSRRRSPRTRPASRARISPTSSTRRRWRRRASGARASSQRRTSRARLRQDRARRSARGASCDPEEKRRVAVHEAGHAVVAALLAATPSRSQRVTIIPRGMALGVTQQSPGADRHLMTQAELESRLRVLMGGYAAERARARRASRPAPRTISRRRRELAFKMVAHYGMSERLGPVYYEHEAEHPFLGSASPPTAAPATRRSTPSRRRRGGCSGAPSMRPAMLERQRPALDRRRALLEHESLERDELDAILGTSAAPGGQRRRRHCRRQRAAILMRRFFRRSGAQLPPRWNDHDVVSGSRGRYGRNRQILDRVGCRHRVPDRGQRVPGIERLRGHPPAPTRPRRLNGLGPRAKRAGREPRIRGRSRRDRRGCDPR